MDRVHCGGVLNRFFSTVKQIIIAKVCLWHFTGQRHNRPFLLWGYHPHPLLTFTHWPRFVPRHNLCHSGQSVNIPTKQVNSLCMPHVCRTEANLLVFIFVFCWLVSAAEGTTQNRVHPRPQPMTAFASPTKQANKKNIYTPRDHFCLRATPQHQDDSIPPPSQTRTAPTRPS